MRHAGRTNKQIGSGLSRVECNVPPRFLIGLKDAPNILSECSRHSIAYLFGFALVITAVIFVSHLLTESNGPDAFHVPIFIVPIPLVLVFFYATFAQSNLHNMLESETYEMERSGMTTKEYLNYKIGDDRTTKSLMGSLASSLILSGSGVLGPFLRGDRR